MFITFEGSDCSGKTTQMRLFSEWLTSIGKNNIVVSDPGTTPFGEAVRNIVKYSDYEISEEAKLLLFLSSRLELCNKAIDPALSKGQIVLCDRFHASTWVYQNESKVDFDQLLEVIPNPYYPDIQFVFNININTFKLRRDLRKGDLDKIDSKPLSYHSDIISKFKSQACALYADNTYYIDANVSIEEVFDQLKMVYSKLCLGK